MTITTGLVDTYSTPTLLRMMAAGRLPARHAHDGFGRIRTRRHRARIAERREELGLTRQDMAAPAGTAASYLRYLEEQPAAMLGTSVLICLTDALDTSLAALHCGDIDLPPRGGQAADHSELLELGPEECRARLSTHGVGRLATEAPDGLVVLPVGVRCVGHGGHALQVARRRSASSVGSPLP
ncbi:hypothetical protein [Streptomyces sp. NPDC091879]|uniref:hypothetical protein n=1 Tax=Streptomyces sp. NPDC091879 TaxID=3366006 RepID=UPI00381C3744